MKKIPLFPLNTVLFPKGILALRIFEPRYLAMVSKCMKTSTPFGVTLIKYGGEAGEAATFHEIGTLARIKDFDQLDDGMLGLSCRGEERFRVLNHEVRPDNLIVAEVEVVPEMQDINAGEDLVNQYQSVRNFLREALEKEELKTYRDTIDEDWEDSSWIGFQLAQLLPLTVDSRQALLEMTTDERLSELSDVLVKNNLL